MADDSPTGSLIQTRATLAGSSTLYWGGGKGGERTPWNPPPCLTPKPSIQPQDPTVQGTCLKEAVSSCMLREGNPVPLRTVCPSQSLLTLIAPSVARHGGPAAAVDAASQAWARDIAWSSPGSRGGLPFNSLVRVTRQKAQGDELRKGVVSYTREREPSRLEIHSS